MIRGNHWKDSSATTPKPSSPTRFVLNADRSITAITLRLRLTPQSECLPGSLRLQIVPERSSGVVLGIVGAEDQGDRSPTRGLQ